MADPDRRTVRPSPPLASEVGASARRALEARRRGPPVVWSGLGTMGAVGWSIVVPTLAGAALGAWLDHHRPGAHSLTLALLVAGLSLGCFAAWHWVASEQKAMRERRDGPP